MAYIAALNKAYHRLDKIAAKNSYTIRMFSDEYSVDLTKHKVLSIIDDRPAKDFLAVFLLHYLIKYIEGLPKIKGRWISFREIEGGEFYYPVFRKRAIDLIIKKQGNNPQALFNNFDKLNAKRSVFGDCGIELEVFDRVPVMATVSGRDEEFPADANILFDESIKQIFDAEDVAVLAGFVAHKL